MAKVIFRRCHRCMEKFDAPTVQEVDNILASHYVYTDKGQKCMSTVELSKYFKLKNGAWVKK